MLSDKLVYHYTNIRGLEGIISNSSFHATSCMFMNDINEFSFIFKLFNNCVEKELKNEDNSFLFKASLARIMESHEFLHNVAKDHLAPFLISFSFEGDMLSQWRGYCPNGGYSLGFSFDGFKEHTTVPEGQPQEWRIIPVSYAPDNAIPEEITKTVQEICSDFKNALPDIDYDPYLSQLSIMQPKKGVQKELKKLQAIERNFGLFLYFTVLTFNPNYKHKSFEEEKEIRITTINNESLQFKSNDFYLKPYKVFHFDLKHLKEIIIGPTNDYERCRSGLKMFLKYHNLEHVEIKKSKIPYRNPN